MAHERSHETPETSGTPLGRLCSLRRSSESEKESALPNKKDIRFKTVQVDGKTIKLQIWDTAGQERFRTITSAYYRGADGVVMVYDITHRESFDHVSEWLAEVNKHASEDCCKLILGNKSDAPGRAVTAEEARAKSEELSVPFLETSAKSNTNVEEAFLTLASELLRRAPAEQPRKKRLSLAASAKEKGRKCCT